ncbi:NAD(P)-binding protein [Micromonospora terminaliae]|uniref:FAD-dependent oxidoreductase n=1 Tax=Micromonospora terminaliae TaxID=1914461 RepID=A0AAJ2ZCV7_9ACTN|nr:FAD-dependent monooxygenase [Micromonospora terminaliae]NES27024.1 FAD-dependent oxidoreductase [Micromonospora terminaliae]QGL48203.1 NAD(P)-binding protein [Micromonospora terminaliae]
MTGAVGSDVEVLVVGAGPTGLTMAAQLARHGVRVRLVDRAIDRVRESRALGVQPRTLEVLAGFGVADRMVAAGNPAVRLIVHAGRRQRSVPLFDLGLPDTAYPYLLFLSQAETERLLGEYLARLGVGVERGVELVGLDPTGRAAVATLRDRDGRVERVPARYVVGCDGAHSAVRQFAGIGFEGAAYPQTFVLADLEVDGVEPGGAHAFLAGRGLMFLFPLGRPAGWRMVAMRPANDATPPTAPVHLAELQTLADAYAGGALRLHDPVWATNFRLHHRAATAYRAGPVFLAGDAAHIHSPAGAQGMNTGIQDAVNLGWKLAQALQGDADPALLDSYHAERAPVGRMVLRFSDRAFTVATTTNPLVRFARTRLAPTLLPAVLAPRFVRATAFRTVAQLAIRYRRSPLSTDGRQAPPKGPRAGDRLPDAPLAVGGSLHRLTAAPGWHLLLCGPPDGWPAHEIDDLTRRHRGRLTAHHLGGKVGAPEADDRVLRRLGVDPGAHAAYLVRPDGHVGYRAGGTDLTGLRAYLRRWFGPSNA